MNWYEQSDVRDVMVKVRLIAASWAPRGGPWRPQNGDQSRVRRRQATRGKSLPLGALFQSAAVAAHRIS